jgi:spermidine synthase
VRHSRLVLAIFILSGAAGLMYEVVWSRQLVLVFGNTTQAVSTILTGFFGGWRSGRSSADAWPIGFDRRSDSTA